jgi:hypothetical protein
MCAHCHLITTTDVAAGCRTEEKAYWPAIARFQVFDFELSCIVEEAQRIIAEALMATTIIGPTDASRIFVMIDREVPTNSHTTVVTRGIGTRSADTMPARAARSEDDSERVGCVYCTALVHADALS